MVTVRRNGSIRLAANQLDDGVGTVEGIELHRRADEIGQEGEVPPVGPQRRLGTAEPGAAHDEAATLVDALGHHRLSARRVLDGDPLRLVDLRNTGVDGLCAGAHGHGERDPQTPQHLDGVIGPIPRVEADDDLASGPGPAQAGHELFDEALGPASGVGRALAQPGMEDLAGVGPRGQDRVVTEHLGVSEGGALFQLAENLSNRGIDVDHQALVSRARPEGPGALKGVTDHLFELAE
jgi:hypothetical protein